MSKHDTIRNIINSLTPYRLTKYMNARNNDISKALELYKINSLIAAALFIDIHFLEVTLRNRFTIELGKHFGNEWFKNEQFLSLIDSKLITTANLKKSVQKALKNNRDYLEGHVISSLSFGFWVDLAAKKSTHTLWTPILSNAFSGEKPNRKNFYLSLDEIREIRNRIAHHDPIFHLNILAYLEKIYHCLNVLDPDTANYMQIHSTTLINLELLSKNYQNLVA